MIDEIIISVKAGDGGDGKVSFRRERFVPKGGPDGGDGGNGGSIYLATDYNLNTLRWFAGRTKFVAESGEPGGKNKRHGANGQDIILKVPVGTMVFYNLSTIDYRLLADLDQPNLTIRLARGGKGGFGNWHFRKATVQTPRHAERGEPGEHQTLKLELKLLANVGLVGLPNTGKSTLLSVLTKAQPKIANYPFTTLSPNLGVLNPIDYRLKPIDSLIVADIPGLIEGAHEGRGLGIKFLKHIERCQIIVYVLAPSDHELNLSPSELAQSLLNQYSQVRQELKAFNPTLLTKSSLTVINKIDLLSEKTPTNLIRNLKILKQPIIPVSAATHQNLDRLTRQIVNFYAKIVTENQRK
ncbi:hypothetical protein A3A66_04715 [Microgenomates group bacterium RIFCSPLOWO2_01_FULL_46_13]|nr:MAG: hypothetical protein A2783_00180 [Microgenomates group bacterium RIFCSPHIGHO2_01_FULL_45_11]OGV94268.1 MAG: hypothetical protein A3A66_04715 [Microgenomates group bacterium RIFCSPLOWO2_01_FULL_46_13]